MRLIDADELLLALEKEQAYLEKENLLNRSFGIGDAIIELCSAPTVDAVSREKYEAREETRKILVEFADDLLAELKEKVEVVRCENCRHNNNCEIQYAAQAGSKFFCAYGERKEE